MEKFQQRFIDEAHDYFENLESALLNLEKDFGNQHLIGEIFRIMHSLKGSGAMFGFDLLSEVTHDMESLYEQIRNGQIQLNSTILSFTLDAVDQFHQLLKLNPGEEEKELAREIKSGIASFLKDVGSDENYSEKTILEATIQQDKQEGTSYFIFFQPNESVFIHGTNPLYLIDELATLGQSKVEIDLSKLPGFSDFDPGKCYVSWKVVLYTEEDVNTIQDVFLFVQDDAVLKIIKLENENILFDEEKVACCFETPPDKIKPFELMAEKQKFAPPAPKEPITEQKRQELVTGVQLSTIRVNSLKIDEYMNLVSELITAQSQLDLLAERNKEVEPISEHFSKLTRQLRDNAFDMSLIPLNNLATRFKRLVRDLSADLNKEVEFVSEGLETEVDKNIIEQLAEPLLHIIRNCIDHGIEPVVKPLGEMLSQHELFMGASILGDGKVSLVMDVKKIIQKFSA